MTVTYKTVARTQCGSLVELTAEQLAALAAAAGMTSELPQMTEVHETFAPGSLPDRVVAAPQRPKVSTDMVR